jgi:hypothetical protein
MTTKTKQAFDQAKQNLSRHGGKLTKMLAGCHIIGRENGTVKIAAGNELDTKWLEARATRYIEHELMGILADEVEVIFETHPDGVEPLANGQEVGISPAYGENKAAIIQPNQLIVQTRYFWHHWRPLLGGSASDVVVAARSLCYWNPKTGERRNKVSTDRSELSCLACCSEKTVTRALKKDLVKRYFVRSKIARTMTSQGARNMGLNLWVRMDDPLTPEDQEKYNLDEPTIWQLCPDPRG